MKRSPIKPSTQVAIWMVLWTTTAAWMPAYAQTVGNTQIGQTQAAATAQAAHALNESDKLQAQIWGLSETEMQRAKTLMQGPRASFSVENISPLEVLGIHARNAKERQEYAEKFAKALREDVERTLAFEREFQSAMQRLYPNSPVVDYSGMEPVEVPTAAADMVNVPRALVRDPADRTLQHRIQSSQATLGVRSRAIDALQNPEKQ
ncbi:integrating conjugative element protein [Lampropedia puyangensis]|uniref:Integrating conjugative element protein n=1 Tax=Lampropedia puyangensis TaxID=1330072 RepID=A0A4S8EU53_9BURK|nr:integrating conjugative element protein [Lampropedia puyangensis]THT98397.1 integrating conjugative element protein [Lampropedia puyangensis]